MIRNSVHHHERAFEGFLRARRIPCVGVDEAHKALLPETSTDSDRLPLSLKSFDFLVYTRPHNLLIDVKGRSAGALSRPRPHPTDPTPRLRHSTRPPRLESWVTLDDIESLAHWESLFGPAFRAAFAFVYPLAEQPPDGLFQEITRHGPAQAPSWFAVITVPLSAYRARMRPRSARWSTVDLSTADLHRLAMPFADSPVGHQSALRAG